MTDATVPFTGWGRAGFGELAWGEGSVAVGSAEGLVGSVEVTTVQRVFVTGVSAPAQVGALREIVQVTGVEAGAVSNRVLVWGREIPAPPTVWTEIAA